jgi:hypothetical protein
LHMYSKLQVLQQTIAIFTIRHLHGHYKKTSVYMSTITMLWWKGFNKYNMLVPKRLLFDIVLSMEIPSPDTATGVHYPS